MELSLRFSGEFVPLGDDDDDDLNKFGAPQTTFKFTKNDDKYNIKKIPHYSHFMSKEDYREKVSLLI